MTNHEISAVEELSVILVLLAGDHSGMTPMHEGAAANWLVETTCRIAYADGWDPDDLIHPEGVEALAMYMYCVFTDTWERAVPEFPKNMQEDLGVPGNRRRSWRWRRVLAKANQLLARRDR